MRDAKRQPLHIGGTLPQRRNKRQEALKDAEEIKSYLKERGKSGLARRMDRVIEELE